ncbi:glycosyl transferase family 2 protein [Aureococcus anophagefferens]|uniref:Glycosyl transferase family 2 protein n=1 Tax=Aureococcus anophagefferens TaxID=44056 RepID=A0ABR1GGC9_AURAN
MASFKAFVASRQRAVANEPDDDDERAVEEVRVLQKRSSSTRRSPTAGRWAGSSPARRSRCSSAAAVGRGSAAGAGSSPRGRGDAPPARAEALSAAPPGAAWYARRAAVLGGAELRWSPEATSAALGDRVEAGDVVEIIDEQLSSDLSTACLVRGRGWLDASKLAPPPPPKPVRYGDAVDVLVPTTASRAAHHAGCYASFACSDYSGPRRLIVVDSGPAPSPFFSNCADPRVTYVHVRGAANDLTIGEKRNRALAELATSPVVANFDDDDLYGPSYLPTMVRALADAGGAGLAKLDKFAYDAETRVAGAFDAADPPAAVPASLVETERKSRGFGFVYARSRVSSVAKLESAGVPLAFVKDDACRMLHVQHGRNVACTLCTEFVDEAFLRRSPVGPLLRHLPPPARPDPFGPMRGVFVFDDAAAAEADVGAWRRRVRDYDANRDRVTAVGEDVWRGDRRARAAEDARADRADRAWRHAVAALQP